MTAIKLGTPFYISEKEEVLVKSVIETIAHSNNQLVSDQGKNIVNMLNALADGKNVTAISYRSELTPQQATEILCVSEPYMINLLDSGEIASRQVGNTRLVKLKDLLEYKETKKRLRHEVLAELVEESQEMGEY